MTGAEPPLGSAAWSAAFGALVIGTVTPDGVARLIVAVAGVFIGIVTRRTLASARGAATASWRIEAGLSFIEVFISLAIAQRTGVSYLAALGIGVGVAAAGSSLIERIITRFEQWASSLVPPVGPIPTPPSDAITPRNASSNARRQLTARESPIAKFGAKITPSPGLPGHDPDQDLLDRMPTMLGDDEPGQ